MHHAQQMTKHRAFFPLPALMINAIIQLMLVAIILAKLASSLCLWQPRVAGRLAVIMSLDLAAAVSEDCVTTSSYPEIQSTFAAKLLATLLAAIVAGMVSIQTAKQGEMMSSSKKSKDKPQTRTMLAILTRGGTIAAFVAMTVDGRRRRWSRKWRHRMKCWARKQRGKRIQRCHKKILAAMGRIIPTSTRSRSMSSALDNWSRLCKMASQGCHTAEQSNCSLISCSWRKLLIFVSTPCIAQLVLWTPGYACVRVGEASNPGPEGNILKLTSANVTSLYPHMDTVSAMSSHAVLLQETRLNEWAQEQLRCAFHEQGWQLLCGLPQPQQRRKKASPSPWNARHGGVAVIVRRGLPAIVAPADSPVRQKLWASGPWMHCILCVANGTQTIHLMSIYGHSASEQNAEAKALNEALLADVFSVAAELGNVPVVIGGDFSTTPEKSPFLRSAMETGRWVDVAMAVSQATGQPAAPTCHSTTFAEGKRIDGFICNAAAIACVAGFEVEPCPELPTHLPITMGIDVGEYGKMVRRFVQPWAFPTDQWSDMESEDEEDLALEALLQEQVSWQTAADSCDVEGMWVSWCQSAEAYLGRRSGHHISSHHAKKYSGRAANREPREFHIAAHQGHDCQGADTVRHRRLLRLARQTEDLSRQVQKIQNAGPGCAPTPARQLWTKVQGTLATLLPQTKIATAGDGINLPSLALLATIAAEIKVTAAKEQAMLKQKRAKQWGETLRMQWCHGPRGKGSVFKQVREQPRAAQMIMRRPDGAYTGNAAELDSLLHETWDPIMRAYAETPQLLWQPFLSRFASYIKSCPMEIDKLTGSKLREVLGRMREGSSGGVEGWRVAEVKRLPPVLLTRLAVLLNIIESSGRWPAGIERCCVSMVPKSDDANPASLRPISVMSVIYRLWAAARVADVMAWQEQWAHSGQHGSRRGHGTEDVYWCLALKIERAVLLGEPLYGISLDYAKCFDNLPQDILLRLASETGLHTNILRPLKSMYQRLRRRFRVAGSVGKEFQATNGILQGCPLSVILLNALISIWAKAVQAEAAGAEPSAYIDDTNVIAKRPNTLQKALDITGDFVRITNQKLQTGKSFSFATSTSRMRRLKVGDERLKSTSQFKIVGAGLSSNEEANTSHHARLEAAMDILRRMAWSPLPFEIRLSLLEGMVMPRCLYGCSVASFSRRQVQTLTADVLKTLLGGKRGRHCAEIAFTLFGRSHVLHPEAAFSYERLVMMKRMLDRRPDIRWVFLSAWQARQYHCDAASGPMKLINESLKVVGWTWAGPYSVERFTGQSINILSIDLGEWEHIVRDDLRHSMWRSAAKRRDDMAGIENGIDRDATKALLGGAALGAQANDALRTIMSGAVWTQDRKFRASLAETAICPYCETGASEDHEHLWWKCPMWEGVRACHGQATAVYDDEWPACFRICGLMPSSWRPGKFAQKPTPVQEPNLTVGLTSSEHSSGSAGTTDCIDLTIEDHVEPACTAHLEMYCCGRVVVYTDGACRGNQFRKQRRAGFGGHWGKDHPFNFGEALEGNDHTNNRAELMAVVRVLQLELRPLEVRTDSQYVHDGLTVHWRNRLENSWMKRGRAMRNRDLWLKVESLIGSRPGEGPRRCSRCAIRQDNARGQKRQR